MLGASDAIDSRDLKLHLEVVPEDAHNTDPAGIGELSRDITQHLRSRGYSIEPVYTKERGGSLFEILLQLGQTTWDNREFLLQLLTAATPLIQALLSKSEEESGQERSQAQVVKITLEVDGAPVTIESNDLDDVAKMVDKLRATHPQVAASMTPESSVKIKASARTRPSRRRR